MIRLVNKKRGGDVCLPVQAALRVKMSNEALTKSGNTVTPARLTATTKGEASGFQGVSSKTTSHKDDLEQRTSTRGRLSRPNKHFIVAGNSHAEDDDTEDVEDGNPPERLFDGPGDVLPRIRRLAKSHAHDLRSGKGEAGLADAGPEAQESPE